MTLNNEFDLPSLSFRVFSPPFASSGDCYHYLAFLAWRRSKGLPSASVSVGWHDASTRLHATRACEFATQLGFTVSTVQQQHQVRERARSKLLRSILWQQPSIPSMLMDQKTCTALLAHFARENGANDVHHAVQHCIEHAAEQHLRQDVRSAIESRLDKIVELAGEHNRVLLFNNRSNGSSSTANNAQQNLADEDIALLSAKASTLGNVPVCIVEVRCGDNVVALPHATYTMNAFEWPSHPKLAHMTFLLQALTRFGPRLCMVGGTSGTLDAAQFLGIPCFCVHHFAGNLGDPIVAQDARQLFLQPLGMTIAPASACASEPKNQLLSRFREWLENVFMNGDAVPLVHCGRRTMFNCSDELRTPFAMFGWTRDSNSSEISVRIPALTGISKFVMSVPLGPMARARQSALSKSTARTAALTASPTLKFVSIPSESDADGKLEVLLTGVNCSFVNALRRIIMVEIDTMAVEQVIFSANSSGTNDEFLAHRLSLVPIRADPDAFEERPQACMPTPTPRNTLVFKLDVTGPEKGHGGHRKVMSSDLRCSQNGDARVACSDIVLARLGPGQRITAECHVQKGKGVDHFKWSPALSYFVPTFSVKLHKEVTGQNARTWKNADIDNIFDVVGRGRARRLVLVRPHRLSPQGITALRALRGAASTFSAEQTGDQFLLIAEPHGQLPAAEVLKRSLRTLRQKAAEVLAHL